MRRPIAGANVALLVGALLTSIATSASAAPSASVEPRPAGAVARADRALSQHQAAVRASVADRFAVYSSKVDANGAAHVRYTRTYQGLRVRGGDIVIHTAPDGAFAGSSVGLAAPLTLGITPKVLAAAAAKAAKSRFSGALTAIGKPELFVEASNGYGRLAWETVLSGRAPDGQTPSRLHVISDAVTGAFIGSYDEIETVDGTGHSVYGGTVTISTTQSGGSYQMVDPTHGNGNTCDMDNGTSSCTTFTDADNVWGNGSPSNSQSAAVDAHYGAALTFDYFKNVHGRNGIFGDGRGVPSRVHFGDNFVNAFWDGAQMTYGDGEGNVNPLISIDVTGHEMSHGVTEHIVPGDLTYSGESGGLNEATSDIFGNMVEFSAGNSNDPGDYDVGEEINVNGDGTPLRYMYNPSLDGISHSCWSTRTKNMDVHYSSGVANHFYFMLAEGSGATPYGTSPVCGSAPAVTGIGRAKAEKIWFHALDSYFTSNTSYVNTTNPANTARAYTLSAATDLYGLCSDEYKTVQTAWTAVNVAGTEPSCAANDFTVATSPSSATLDPGTSTTTTVSATLIRGSAQNVTLSASGLPSGATAAFSPSTINSDGGSSTMTINTSASTPMGVYTVTVTGTGIEATRTTSFTLTVNGPPGCSGSNNSDVAIPDDTTVDSVIVISGCAGNASATSTVEVHIVHTYIGDLAVSLAAPDGTTYQLHNHTGGGTDNIDQTYTVDLADETANGTWRLRVEDTGSFDTGYINSWRLDLGDDGTPPGCGGTNDTNVTIPDLTTVESSITVSGCSGNASATSTVEVHIVHTYIGDLVVSLVAPDGTTYQLHNRTGGGTDNIDQTYTVNLADETANGTWKLRVKDASSRDTGHINSWTLTL